MRMGTMGTGVVRGEPFALHERAHALALVGLDVEEREVRPVLGASHAQVAQQVVMHEVDGVEEERAEAEGEDHHRGLVGGPVQVGQPLPPDVGPARREEPPHRLHQEDAHSPEHAQGDPDGRGEGDPRPGARRLQHGESDDAEDEHEHGARRSQSAGRGPGLEGAPQHGQRGHLADGEQRQQREEARHPGPESEADGDGGRERARRRRPRAGGRASPAAGTTAAHADDRAHHRAGQPSATACRR
jgi:hypothetical protein